MKEMELCKKESINDEVAIIIEKDEEEKGLIKEEKKIEREGIEGQEE